MEKARGVFETRGIQGQEKLVEEVKEQAATLLKYMDMVPMPLSQDAARCFAVAKTKLEEHVMWFTKGISRL